MRRILSDGTSRSIRELMQRVVDSGQRHLHAALARGGMKLFGGHMLVLAIEQKSRQQLPLPRQAQFQPLYSSAGSSGAC